MTSVLVVRRFDEFGRILQENGFSLINCPTIETVRSEKSRDLSAQISTKNYDGIFLTSRKATEIAVSELLDKDFAFGGVFYVLGRSSFELLKDKSVRLFFNDTANSAREMIESIPRDELKNKRFLFIRGEKSLGTVEELLSEIASVDEEIVYETRRLAVSESLKGEIETAAESGTLIAACFFSPSGAESFLEQCGARILHQTRIAAIGKTTADFFEKQNFEVDFVPLRATAKDYAIELTDYLNSEKRKMENGK